MKNIFVRGHAIHTCSQLSEYTRNFDQSNGKLLMSPQLLTCEPFWDPKQDLLKLITETKESQK